jgi:hypothetical protein
MDSALCGRDVHAVYSIRRAEGREGISFSRKPASAHTDDAYQLVLLVNIVEVLPRRLIRQSAVVLAGTNSVKEGT